MAQLERGVTVLIIEDDPQIRGVLCAVLERAGFQVEVAHDGQEGYERACRIAPGLILCDVNMDGLDGLSVLELIRRDERLCCVPFIFMSGVRSEADRARGMALGADDFLLKPFSLDELLQLIHSRLQRHQALQARYERIIQVTADRMSEALQAPLRDISDQTTALRSQWRQLRPSDIEQLLQVIERQSQQLADLSNRWTLEIP